MLSGGHLIAITALMIPIVAIVMGGITKIRTAKARGLSSAVEEEVLARAEKLEERVGQLERILDAEAPGWRRRH